MKQIRFDGRVAIVTGAGGGLGRAHALGLATRGARVVVNDLGGALDGSGGSSAAARAVVDEIADAGGEAIANGSSVADPDGIARLVADTLDAFGRIDILINNAGILRDRSFAKMTAGEFDAVLDVHLRGAAHLTLAVWQVMKGRRYGRVVFTTSSSGLYGNFGQANYGAAKLGQVGLLNCLKLEGPKDGIHVNAVAPIATTRMTEALFPAQLHRLFDPAHVTPAVLLLASEQAPNGEILCAGGGHFACARIVESRGVTLGADAGPEALAEAWSAVVDMRGAEPLEEGARQTEKFSLAAMSPERRGS